MKKITVFILALSLALSLCACSKASRMPSLAEIAENGAEWGGEKIRQVQGCTLADLEKAWGEANGELPGEYAYFWKVDDTTSVNVYYHRNAEIEHITVTSADDQQEPVPVTPDFQPAQMSLAQVGGSSFDLSEENARAIQQILDAGSWVPDATDCASDYMLTFDDRTIYYHSDCGTFNEQLEQSDQSLRLSDAERETVNRIIQAVIPHDLIPNAPIEISDVFQMEHKMGSCRGESMNTVYEEYRASPIDKGLLCLEHGEITTPYFCYPVNAEPIGFEGCIMYCFLPEYGEMVFACNPESCADQNVYPLAANFEDFIRLILACGTANPVEQIVWMDKSKFEEHMANEEKVLTDEQKAAVQQLQRELDLLPMEDPFEYVKAIQKDFDGSKVQYSDDYFEVTGIENPKGTATPDQPLFEFEPVTIEVHKNSGAEKP